jgi:tetratricopeptide (TPR) repeat protein
VYNLLGRLANQQGANTLAVTYFEKALALYRRLGDVVGEARTQNLIGTVQFEMGKWSAAEMSFRQASEHFLRLGDVYYLAGVNNNMGIIALNQGRLDEALEIYQQGLDLLKQRREGALYLRALFEASLGATFIRRGEGETARKHLQRAQDYCQQIEARDFFPELHRLWAEAALLAGDLGEAVVQAKKSLELARELGMRGDEGRTLRVLGQIIAAQGQLDLAVDQLGQSIAILAEVGDEYEQARSRLALAGAYLAQGNVEAGEAALAQCRPVFERLGSELDLAAAQTLQKKLVRKG